MTEDHLGQWVLVLDECCVEFLARSWVLDKNMLCASFSSMFCVDVWSSFVMCLCLVCVMCVCVCVCFNWFHAQRGLGPTLGPGHRPWPKLGPWLRPALYMWTCICTCLYVCIDETICIHTSLRIYSTVLLHCGIRNLFA